MGQVFALLPGSITICGMGASRLSAADAISEESDSTARSWDNNPSEKRWVLQAPLPLSLPFTCKQRGKKNKQNILNCKQKVHKVLNCKQSVKTVLNSWPVNKVTKCQSPQFWTGEEVKKVRVCELGPNSRFSLYKGIKERWNWVTSCSPGAWGQGGSCKHGRQWHLHSESLIPLFLLPFLPLRHHPSE